MRRRNLAGWTIDGRLSDVRTFSNWLVRIGKIGVTPFGKDLMPKRKQSEPRYYTTSEYMALDKQLVKIHPPTSLLCAIAHSAGCREAEMVGHAGDPVTSDRIQMEDISWFDHGAELLIRKELTKTNKTRTLPLDPGIVERLGSRRSGAIFPITRYQAYHYFRRARELSGIDPNLDIHGLRHTFAKNYLQRGDGNLASLSRLMGHASIVSTMIYAQFEKSYFREGINRAYERRLVEENLAGQNAITSSLAGQMTGTLLKQSGFNDPR
jgi:integrase